VVEQRYRIPGVENGVVRGPLMVLAEPRRGHPHNGTRALMLAVFEDAVRCYLSGHGRVKIEAEEWVHSLQRRSPFSFVVVCETLGLAPSAVRGALQRFREERLAPPRAIGRTRPYARRARRTLPDTDPAAASAPAAWVPANPASYE
jgi:hypothetical protein